MSADYISIRNPMYPKSCLGVHIRADVYPKSRFRVHIRADVYPKSRFGVHIRADVYPKSRSFTTGREEFQLVSGINHFTSRSLEFRL